MTTSNDTLSRRRTRPLARLALGLGLAASLALIAPAPPAEAQPFVLQLEAAGGLWLDTPQSDRFTPGLYLAIRPGLALGRVVSLQWSYALLHTPAAEGFTDDGTAHFATAGIRLRPLATLGDPATQLGGLFVDLNLGYVRTGGLDRFGFDVGLGFGFQVASWLALGPVVRYVHIVQPDVPDFDDNDGKLLSIGLNFSFGPAYVEEEEEERWEERPCPSAPECPPAPRCPEPTDCCPDADGDGVCDAVDRCPHQAGPASNYGCPTNPCTGEPIVVLVQFEDNSAELPPRVAHDRQTMDPVLEAVGDAIAQDATCRVCIIGYASEEGDTARNLDLSRRRAGAVQGYLAARDLDRSRMPTTGFGDTCQLVPEQSRVLNRRVEFRRLDEGESCPTKCPE